MCTVRESNHCARQERYLARIRRPFLDAPDNLPEAFIIGRRNHSGKNVHAAALARMRDRDPPAESTFRMGRRRGVQVRLEKRRLARVILIRRAEPFELCVRESGAPDHPLDEDLDVQIT
jgi:hypothetical protein